MASAPLHLARSLTLGPSQLFSTYRYDKVEHLCSAQLHCCVRTVFCQVEFGRHIKLYKCNEVEEHCSAFLYTHVEQHTRCSPSSSATFLGEFFISSSSLPDVRLCTASSINNMKPAIATLRPNCDVGKSWTQKFTPILDVGYTTLAEPGS